MPYQFVFKSMSDVSMEAAAAGNVYDVCVSGFTLLRYVDILCIQCMECLIYIQSDICLQ